MLEQLKTELKLQLKDDWAFFRRDSLSRVSQKEAAKPTAAPIDITPNNDRFAD